MRRLASWVIRRRWPVVIGALMFLPIAGVVGGTVTDKLSAGGLENPDVESARAAAALVARFPSAAEPDFVILVTSTSGSIDDDPVARAGIALTRRLARQREVVEADSYWTLSRAPPLGSTDERQALVVAALRGDLNERVEAAERLSPLFTRHDGTISSAVSGVSEVWREVIDRSEKDLQRSELLTAPIVAAALVLVFGSLVAAALPLVVGVLAVVGTLLVLWIIASLTEVSVFSLNLTTGLGLGLAIDYALFVVSRYREELGSGVSTRVAIVHTMQTAGRTVAFSAGTVMISLLSLLMFPIAYLRSFAYAGFAVVGLAAVAAIVVLPAMLAVLGPRVEKGRVFKPRARKSIDAWSRQARRVMAHPWLYALGATAVLVMLAMPMLRIQLGQIDDRVIRPEASSSRRVTDQIRANFTSRENAALRLLLRGVNPDADAAAIDGFARQLQGLPGVARVDAASGFYFEDGQVLPPSSSPVSRHFTSATHPNDTWVNVVPDIEPISSAAERLVDDVRSVSAPFEFTVAGPSARLVDTKELIGQRLPLAVGFIALVTFMLLFMMTGSLLVPLKALALNVLSLTAAFGAMVLVFQDGRFTDLLGYTPTGFIDTFTPILMFCIAFGLSMDYEVFLLSRIKEEYDYDHDNERAVAVGLGKTGGIVTTAALVLTIVFLGLTASEVFQVKLLGLGLSLAVLVDAFVIRATLVPAFMRLAGRFNWWAPRPVRRWYLRAGIWENEPIKILDRALERER